MSCFFCDSLYHVSHNCDIYKSNESRENIVSNKNCCPNCLNISDDDIYCNKCKFSQNCYICFSMYHSTIYCPKRFDVPNIFPPKIDENLFFRFGQLLNVEEKWAMVFSYPKMFDILKFKHLKIKFAEKCSFADMQYYSDYDIVISKKGSIQGIVRSSNILLNPPIFYIQYLEIYCLSLFSQEFLLLLSPKTKILKCKAAGFRPELSLCQILEKVPNLEEIEIQQTNVKIDNSWPDDILRLNKLLNYLDIKIPDLSFNIDSFVNLFKKTSVKILLTISSPAQTNTQNQIENVRKKLSEHFIPRNKLGRNVRFFVSFQHGLDVLYYAFKQ